MAAVDDYRRKAAEMNARATKERDPSVKAELQNLGLSYLRLASQAERNAHTDFVFERPPERPAVQQQQQQPKNKPTDD